jgi:hypothetical protein
MGLILCFYFFRQPRMTYQIRADVPFCTQQSFASPIRKDYASTSATRLLLAPDPKPLPPESQLSKSKKDEHLNNALRFETTLPLMAAFA